MRKLFAALVLLAGCRSAENVPADVHVVEYQNGRWFNGQSFDTTTWYTVGAALRSVRPNRVDELVDLSGRWVVLPYAEGHNHWLEPAAIDAYVQSYLRDGVFYLKDHANAPVVRTRMDSTLNRPGSVDFISPNQGFTGPAGHPIQIAKQFLAFGSFPEEWTEADLEGNVFFVIDSLSDIARAWPKLIAGRPDFVKVFLLYSEDYARRSRDSAFRYRRGIDPTLVGPIVQRAHASGLRVSAHVYTAADFHNAINAGVDDIAHMPGTGFDSTLGPAAFRIAEEDAALAGKRGATVLTTVSWLSELDSAHRTRIVSEVIRPNIEMLRRHGVKILIGSDLFRETPAREADLLASLGLFSNADLLRMWSMDTPAAIFPRRKIARFADGYEASFLVLESNPLDNFASAHQIAMRVKQGLKLSEPKAVIFPPLGN